MGRRDAGGLASVHRVSEWARHGPAATLTPSRRALGPGARAVARVWVPGPQRALGVPGPQRALGPGDRGARLGREASRQ